MTSRPRIWPSDDCPAWRWAVAIVAFDYGDRQPYADLIRNGEVMPPELAGVAADIASGIRKPRGKAAGKIRVAAKDRLAYGAAVAAVVDLADEIQTRIVVDVDSDLRGVRALAEMDERYWHREAVDIRREIECEKKHVIQTAATGAEVSAETIKSLVRDYRRVIRDYPNI